MLTPQLFATSGSLTGRIRSIDFMSSKAQPWSECGDERLVVTGRPGFSIKQEAAEVCTTALQQLAPLHVHCAK